MKHMGWAWALLLGCLTVQATETRVWIFGDSLVRETSFTLRKMLAEANVPADTFVTLGSAWTRPDLFDWHAKLREIVKTSKPELVLFMMGASDRQNMMGNGQSLAFGSAAWDAEYARRLDSAFEILTSGGVRHVIYVGLPDLRDEEANRYAHHLNELIQTRVAANPAVRFFDAAKLLSRKPGQFSVFIPGKDGMPVLTRSSDGVHLTPQGGDILAQALWTEIKPLVDKPAKP